MEGDDSAVVHRLSISSVVSGVANVPIEDTY